MNTTETTTAAPKFIVSANYRDRSAANKWLVRREDQPEAEAREVASVRCIGVQFRDSAQYGIRGGGCTDVAVCDSVVENPELSLDGGDRIKFSGYFYEAETGNYLTGMSHLELKADGSMFRHNPAA